MLREMRRKRQALPLKACEEILRRNTAGVLAVPEDPAEKRAAFETLAAKYTPDDEAGRKAEIDRFFRQARLVEITVDHLSGKEAIEFVKARTEAAAKMQE